MRTKALLFSAALVAAGVATSMAQSNVYSLNIVGYVNVPVQKGKIYLIENPLDTGTGNNITNVIIQPYNGTNGIPDPNADYGWDGAQLWTFTQGGGYGNGDAYFTGFGWFPGELVLNPGVGFFFLSTSNSTVTFTGSVTLGSTNTLPHGISLVGSPYPAAMNLTQLGLTGADSDVVFRFYGPGGPPAGYTGSAESFGQGVSYFAGYGWFDSDAPSSTNGGNGGGSTNGPTLNVGEAFFYNNFNAPFSWAQNFTVN